MNRHEEDYQVDGQMNIYDYFEEPVNSPLIAVSKIFAAAIKQMNLAEWKTVVFALTHIKWNEANKNYVRLDKKELAKLIGIKSDINHLSQDIKRSIGQLPTHSFIEFQDEDKWVNGCFITQIACYKNIVRVKFDDSYMPLFQELNREKNYITMWAEDLFKLKSERSILFYEDLRLHCDTRKENTRTYSVKDFKKLFSIPKDGKGSYMRKDGHFDRQSFERYVIRPLCDELKSCRMIQLCVEPDGKFYNKVKNNHGNVLGYKFTWNISEHPAVATAEEVKQIQDRVDKNPEVLKVAKDLLNGKKKKPKENGFDNFNHHDYDYTEIQRVMMQQSVTDNNEN